MNNLIKSTLNEIAIFNPSESLKKGNEAKKIPMGFLQTFNRKIVGHELSKYSSGPKFRNGDTLVAKITPCLENGKTAFVDILDHNELAFGSSEFIVLRSRTEADILFLYYLSISPTFRKRAISCMEGTSGRKRVNENTLKFFNLPIPKANIRPKIANILSALDEKIELNNKINAELEAMAKLIYDYWFVQFDFPFDFAQGKPDANGKPYKSSGGKMVYNETLKREIPDEWEAFQLSSVVKCNYSSIGKSDCYKEIEYLDTGNLTKNIIESTERINTELEKLPSRAKRIIHKNDILYSTVRPKLCHYGIIKKPQDNMVGSTGFVQLSSDIDWVSNDLIYTFLTSSWITNRLQQIASLAVSAYPSISPNDILELNIALPKEGKGIEPINSKFDTIYSKISLNQRENKKLSELRDWLLPMLMNGQVTVKD